LAGSAIEPQEGLHEVSWGVRKGPPSFLSASPFNRFGPRGEARSEGECPADPTVLAVSGGNLPNESVY